MKKPENEIVLENEKMLQEMDAKVFACVQELENNRAEKKLEFAIMDTLITSSFKALWTESSVDKENFYSNNVLGAAEDKSHSVELKVLIRIPGDLLPTSLTSSTVKRIARKKGRKNRNK